jgi:O-antigen/teichoic acid export membrane protein
MHQLNLRKNSLIKSLALFGGSTTAAQFIMMIYVLIVARVLGPTELGFFNSAYSLVGITAFFLNLGMDTWLLRKAGLYSDVTILSGKVLRIKAAIGIFWSLMLVVIAPMVRPDLYTVPMMLICSLDAWSDVCFNTEIQALNVQRRMKAITWLVLLSRGGRLLGLTILLLVGLESAVWFALTRALATFVGFAVATFFHRPKLSSKLPISTKEVLSESLPFGVSEFLSLIYTNIDVTILAWMAGKTAVGLYSPASGIIHALFVIPNAMFSVMVPIMTKLGANSIQRFRSSLRSLFLSFIALGLVMWLAVGLLGNWVMPWLLGDEYQFSGRILAILSSILFFKSIGFACAIVLVSVGWQHKRLLPQLISAVFNITANIVLIPKFGIEAVAWVYVISEFILAVAYGWITIQWIRSGIFEHNEKQGANVPRD